MNKTNKLLYLLKSFNLAIHKYLASDLQVTQEVRNNCFWKFIQIINIRILCEVRFNYLSKFITIIGRNQKLLRVGWKCMLRKRSANDANKYFLLVPEAPRRRDRSQEIPGDRLLSGSWRYKVVIKSPQMQIVSSQAATF